MTSAYPNMILSLKFSRILVLVLLVLGKLILCKDIFFSRKTCEDQLDHCVAQLLELPKRRVGSAF